MTKHNLGYYIGLALEENHLSVDDMARQMGKTSRQVRCWLNNVNTPPVDDLWRIMEITGKDANYFLRTPSHRHSGKCASSAFPQTLEERIENLEQVLAHIIKNKIEA